MSNSKRGASFGRYDDHTIQPNKRSKHHQNRVSYQHGNLRLAQPALTASQMRTGLVVLLDTFIADEMTPEGDGDILYHARELRRLLCSQTDPKAAEIKSALDEKRPDKVPKVLIPDYIERRVRAAADLPPLPPIAEAYLHDAVFTHRSAHVNLADPRQLRSFSLDIDYERLELLGDAYIELMASRALYNRFPQVDVPELCSLRERLVENTNLSKFSHAYDFPARLKHKSTLETGSKGWLKVTADIFEAYVAALVLADPENGFNIAEEWLTVLWAPQLLAFKEKILENPQARNQLNKLIVAKDVKLDFREEKPMTFDSNKIQRYYIGIYLTGWGYTNEWLGSGESQNKAQAAVAAAIDALNRNGPALQDAASKKADLMDKRREANKKENKEKPKPEVEVKNGGQISGDVLEHEGSNHQVNDAFIDENDGEKRRSEDQESHLEKKRRKEKKDKKEEKKVKKESKKKRKASLDDDDSRSV